MVDSIEELWLTSLGFGNKPICLKNEFKEEIRGEKRNCHILEGGGK